MPIRPDVRPIGTTLHVGSGATIWKFPLTEVHEQTLTLPGRHAYVLSVGQQEGNLDAKRGW